mmetsp:Transcript_20637/g.40871  ORF Transcript_20637/g.40871 Transcript_20637/m.40871 type:complete len:406 (+) Transcript_20637:21-1238(+)
MSAGRTRSLISIRNEKLKVREEFEEQLKIKEMEKALRQKRKPKRHRFRLGRFDTWREINISDQRYGHDGNYIVTCLFHFLWIRKPSFISSSPDLEDSLGLPDTIVFDRVDPIATRFPNDINSIAPNTWYFTSIEDGKVRRKGLEAMHDKKHVIDTFSHQSRHIRQVDVVAQWTIQTRLPLDADEGGGGIKDYTGPTRKHLSTIFFDKRGLEEFWDNKSQMLGETGFLQKFVQPQGEHNEVIRCDWGKRHCNIQTCLNSRSLHASANSMYQRATTYSYDGPKCNSAVAVETLGSVFPVRIKTMCWKIAQHIMSVTQGHKDVFRMCLYFKLGQRNKLYLLGCDYLQFEDEATDLDRKRFGRGNSPRQPIRNTFDVSDSDEDKLDNSPHRHSHYHQHQPQQQQQQQQP